MDLISQLNQLGAYAQLQIPNLNNGGCCVFAAMVARELRDMGVKVGGVPIADIMWGDPTWGNVDEARANVSDPGCSEQWEENGIAFSHVGLEVEIGDAVYYFDSRGLRSFDAPMRYPEWKPLPGRLTVEEMEALAERPHNWNWKFDRTNIPYLKQIVEDYLG